MKVIVTLVWVGTAILVVPWMSLGAGVTFEQIDYDYLSAHEYHVSLVSLSDFVSGEVLLVRLGTGHLAKLRIAHWETISAGTTVYSVKIDEGVTYTPDGRVAATYSDISLRPGQWFDLIEAAHSSTGHIRLRAEVRSTYRASDISYHLESGDDSSLARCRESRPDATIWITISGVYSASFFVDGKLKRSIYGSAGSEFHLDPGKYSFRIDAHDFKSWEREVTLEAGDQLKYEVELIRNVTAAFDWQPDSPAVGEPILFDAADSKGEVVQYEWDWDADGVFDESSTDPTAEHAFSKGEYHAVVLRVTDEDQDVDVASEVVQIELPPGQPPVASIAYHALSVEEPLEIRFDASGSVDVDGTIVTYRWDFGDGTSTETQSDSPTITHIYEESGAYLIALEAIDDVGLSGIARITIDIETPNTPPVALFTWDVVTADGSRLLVEPRTGDRVAFDASASQDADGQIVRYEWDWDSDGTYELVAPDPTVETEFVVPGSRDVTLRVVDDRGATAMATQTLAVGEKLSPIARFDLSPTFPSTLDSVAFADRSNDPDGTITQWNWAFGDGTVATEQNPAHQFRTKGSFDVLLTVTDDDGLTATSTKTVVVGNLPPEPSFTLSPLSPTVDRPAAFDASSSRDPDGEIVLYEWDFTGDGTADAEGIRTQWTFESSEPVTVVLRTTDDTGETENIRASVTPNHAPAARLAWEAYRADGSPRQTPPRTGDTLRFDASASHDLDGTIESFAWDWNGDGTVDEQESTPIADHTFTDPGEHRISLQVIDDDGVASEVAATFEIHAKQPPNAAFDVTPSVASILDPAALLDRSTDPDGEIVSWSWAFGDGLSSDTQHPTHRYEDKGTYTVSLTVSDDDGLTSTATRDLLVANLPPQPVFAVVSETIRCDRVVRFDASETTDPDGTIQSYSWDLDEDGANDASGASVEWTYSDPATVSVRLEVTDNDGAMATTERLVTIKPGITIVEPADVWALVIGISDYENVKDLRYAGADALAFAEWLLASGVDTEHIVLLLDEKKTWPELDQLTSERATLTKTRGGLDWLRRMARPDDLVFVYFAGHGYQGEDDDGDEEDGVDEFLVLLDAEKTALEATSLRDDEFGRFLDRVESEHVMVVFDSCHSGGQSRSLSGGTRPLADEFDIFNDFSLDGKLVLAAAREDQEALEHEALSHGVFTHYLLRGLEGEADLDTDYRITADELFTYVKAEVEQFAREQRGRDQTPEMRGRGSVGIVLGRANRPPEASFSISPNKPYACGATVFTNRSNDDMGILCWQWAFGDGATSTDQHPTHTYEEAGTYTVTLTVTDDEGASSTVEQQIAVAPPGQVTAVAGDTIIVSLGSANGIEVGDRFEVVRLLVLSTGITIEEHKATIEVIEVIGPDRAACRAVDTQQPIEREDVVRREECE